MIGLMSFGFKHGEPTEGEVVFDVRDLPNPFYIPELKDHTGLETCVRDYVMQFPESQERLLFLQKEAERLIQEGDTVSIAIGCTGGHHRSVTMVEELKEILTDAGFPVSVIHRDIQKGM